MKIMYECTQLTHLSRNLREVCCEMFCVKSFIESIPEFEFTYRKIDLTNRLVAIRLQLQITCMCDSHIK